jgi:hypothetical protein
MADKLLSNINNFLIDDFDSLLKPLYGTNKFEELAYKFLQFGDKNP